MMVCSSPQETHITLSSRSQNFPGTFSLNLHLPNVNTAPESINNNTNIVTRSYNAHVAKENTHLARLACLPIELYILHQVRDVNDILLPVRTFV